MNNNIENIVWGKWHQLRLTGDTVIIAVGAMAETALEAHEIMKDEKELSVINARFVKPLDTEMLDYCMDAYKNIITIEENSFVGGLGQMVSSYLSQKGYKGRVHSFAIPDRFITHGSRKTLLEEVGLNVDSLIDYIRSLRGERRGFLQKISFKKSDHRKTTVAVFNNGARKVSEK